jgi:hypothetical protein
MAKLKSLLKIEGTLDGMTFYKNADGQYYVKTKGGISKDKILNDPAFERTRENNQEFAEVSKSGKLLRRALIELLANVKDRTKTNRLSSVLFKVKNQDSNSLRGQRKVSLGMQTQEGKEILSGFEFNQNAPLDAVLLNNYKLDTAAQEIHLTQFTPSVMLAAPQGATHFNLYATHVNYDFSTGQSDMVISNIVDGVIDNSATDITLSFATPVSGEGIEMYLLKIEFLQELNATRYPLKNGTFNSLKLIKVI